MPVIILTASPHERLTLSRKWRSAQDVVESFQQEMRDRRTASMRTYGRRSTRKELPRGLYIVCPRQNDHDRTVSGRRRRRSGGPRSYTCSLHLCGWDKASGHVLTPKHFNGISQAALYRILDRDDAASGSPCGWDRYTQAGVEFWIKSKGATLTRAVKSTTCRTGD
jgi:hypothetical protein